MSVQEKQLLIKPPKTENTENYILCRHFVLAPIVLVTFLGYGMSYYAITQWIQHFVSVELFPNSTVNSSANDGCKETNHSDPDYIAFQQVETNTAAWQMYFTVACGIPAFVSTTLLPSYSDRFGRRFLFIIGVTGMVIKIAATAVVVYYKLSLLYIVAAAAIEGMTGSVYAFTAASCSYIADITTPGRQRTIGITLNDGLLLISITFSGLAAGVLLKTAGFFLTIVICAALEVLSLLLIIFFIQETHDKKYRSKTVSISSNFRRTIDFYSSSEFKGKRCAYFLLIFAYLFEECVTSHRAGIEMLYQLGQPLCWHSEKIGYYSAARHAAQGLLGMMFIAPMKKCFSELQIAILSTISNAGSYVLEAFARTDLIMYLVPVVSTWSFLTVPMVKSIMSSMTSVDKQGSLFASITAIQSVSGIIATFAFNTVYAATIHIMDGFVFLVLAAVCTIVFLILVIFSFVQPVHKPSEDVKEKIVP